jgi:putative membrane protein
MKSISLKILAAMMLVGLFISCEPKKQEEDSAEIAKESNDAALEDRDEEKDADFVVNTIAASYCEVKLAQLAKNRSKDAGVKEIANMLETDHNKVINQLKGYAAKNGISVPLEETEEQKKDINDLASERDPNKFDEKWVEMLEDNHEKTIDKFEKRLNKTEDLELKNWITETLPSLKSHLDMLKKRDDAIN